MLIVRNLNLISVQSWTYLSQFIFSISFLEHLFPFIFVSFLVLLLFPQAYKKLVEKEGTEGALPGLGLTEEQLFFVGFARVGIIATINPHKHLVSNIFVF